MLEFCGKQIVYFSAHIKKYTCVMKDMFCS